MHMHSADMWVLFTILVPEMAAFTRKKTYARGTSAEASPCVRLIMSSFSKEKEITSKKKKEKV